MHAFREQGRTLPRILYWFRTPVSTKIGRSAIDEEAIRLIEEHYRGVSFDWAKILQSRAVTEAERTRGSDRQRPEERRGHPREEPPGPPDRQPEEIAAASASPADERPRRRRSRRKRDQQPADATGLSDAQTPAARATEATEPVRASAAEEVFSLEDLTRLRGRHAALLARIDREVCDASAAGELREASEALNPDSWVTRADVEDALEHYEQRYRQLLDRLGPGRKRVASPDVEGPADGGSGSGDDPT